MDWRLQAGFTAALAVVILTTQLSSRRRTRRLRQVCYRYAGYDDQRTGGGEYPPASKMQQGLEDELARLMSEMGVISNYVQSVTSSTYDFFVNASYWLPGFLDASIGGSLESELRRQVFGIISQAEMFFEDLGENPKIDDEFFDGAYQWLDKLRRWLEVVERIGPEIGRGLQIEASNRRLC